MMETAILAVAGTLAGVLLGQLLGAKNAIAVEVREKRRILYSEWILWLDRQPLEMARSANTGQVEAHFDKFHDALAAITSQLELFGSIEVIRAWTALHDVLGSDALTSQLLDAVRNPPADLLGKPDLAILRSWRSELESPRRQLLIAMRKDIGAPIKKAGGPRDRI